MDAQKQFRTRKKKKVCTFCADKIEHIDYKDVARLRKCVSERAKILPRRIKRYCVPALSQSTQVAANGDSLKLSRHVAISATG